MKKTVLIKTELIGVGFKSKPFIPLQNIVLGVGVYCFQPVCHLDNISRFLLNRVRTDLENSLKLTFVLENSWNLKIVPFVLELSWNFAKLPLKL